MQLGFGSTQSNMKKYTIPCAWQMYGFYHIEAENLEEAIEKAEDSELPKDADYVETSFEIDTDMIPFYNDEEKKDASI